MNWRGFFVAVLAGVSFASAVGSAGETGPGGPDASVAAQRLSLGGEAWAAFDDHGRLLIGTGTAELVRGGLFFFGPVGRGGQDNCSAERLVSDVSTAAWSLTGPQLPGAPRIELRARLSGESIAVAGVLDFRRQEELSGWEYRLVLPAKAHGRCELSAGGTSVRLPPGGGAAAPLRIVSREFSIKRDARTVLRVLRDVPCLIEVLDLRAQDGTYVVRMAVEGAEALGIGQGRFAIALGTSDAPVKPWIYHHRAWPPDRPGAPIRCQIGVLAEYGSPFDVSAIQLGVEVQPPEGQALTQPAFMSQPFASRVEQRPAEATGAVEPGAEPRKVEAEVLTPAGQPGWEAAVDARHAGVYRLRPGVRTKEGEFWGDACSLLVTPAADARMGPLSASRRDERFLADPQGQAVFLLGHNLGWLVNETGPQSLDNWCRALDRMKAAGLNYCRIWMCTWSLAIERPEPYSYDLGRAWKLERILFEAHRRGIYVQLCLDNFHDFHFKRELSPFFAGKQPVCGTGRAFFESPAARSMYLARLRYLVARYGHFDNLLAWELFNEIDFCVDGERTAESVQRARREYLVGWTREVAGGLRTLDRRRHLVTCSLSDGAVWPELTAAPEIGLAESHVYIHMPDAGKEQMPISAFAAVRAAGAELARFGKPGFISEFGFGADGGPVSPTNEVDRLGVHLHNGLWGSALGGQAGAAALWWWDSYLAPGAAPPGEISGDDRYQHYRALAAFLLGVDWLAGWRELKAAPAASGSPRPMVCGLRTDSAVLIWVADPENTWYNRAVKGYRPPRVEDAAFAIDGMRRGRYEVEWWDAYIGRRLTTSHEDADRGGTLRLTVPAFTRDIAAKVRFVAEGADHE